MIILIEIKVIKTSGDIFQNKKNIGYWRQRSILSKQIEEELLESKIDLAIHSLKDLPYKNDKKDCVLML